MTREEAKEVFLNRGFVEVEDGTVFDGNKWRQAYIVISKWLEQEPCEDAVSRQAVIEITAETGALETQIRVKTLPSVTPQPKTGRWIVKDYYTKMGEHYKGYECPVCHKEYNLKTNFCPDCGNRNGE